MSDISVSEADLIVLLQELESRGLFKTVIITGTDGVQELKAIVPVTKITINTPQEEE
jgi:trehalose-6-phosphatase|tara:strand:- start:83 stop:253 length:171 start_codon:yes stop_codon:yes gene_type:complete